MCQINISEKALLASYSIVLVLWLTIGLSVGLTQSKPPEMTTLTTTTTTTVTTTVTTITPTATSTTTTATITTTPATTTTTVSSGKSVLILYTQSRYGQFVHEAVITNGNGKEEHAGVDFRFSFGQNTEVDHSCSITWHGEMFIFGGWQEQRQISKLTGCSLERVGTLSFYHEAGACTAVNDNEICLCFNLYSGDYKKCRKANDPMGVYEEINPTNYEHVYTRIGASSDALLAIGDYKYSRIKKVEMLELNGSEAEEWRQLGDYPRRFVKFIAFAPIVYHANAFYVVGGFVGVSDSNIIGRLDASTLTWTKAGKLNYARYGHGAIFNGERIIVTGGIYKKKTESCSVNENGNVNCIEQAPTLDNYRYYPEMFLVDDAFCKDT